MTGWNAIEHSPKKVTAEDQIEAIGVTTHRKMLYHFLGFVAGKRLNQTFETLGDSHHKLQRLSTDGRMLQEFANWLRQRSDRQAELGQIML